MNKADSTVQLVYHQGQSHQIIQTQIYPKKNQWIVIYEGILKEHDIEDSSAYILGNYPFNCQQKIKKVLQKSFLAIWETLTITEGKWLTVIEWSGQHSQFWRCSFSLLVSHSFDLCFIIHSPDKQKFSVRVWRIEEKTTTIDIVGIHLHGSIIPRSSNLSEERSTVWLAGKSSMWVRRRTSGCILLIRINFVGAVNL